MRKAILTGVFLASGLFTFGQNINEVNKADVDNLKKSVEGVEKPDSTSNWKVGSVFNANFTNTGLVNWQGGGQDALTLTGIYTGFATYKNGNNEWASRLEMGYGITRLGGGSGGTSPVLRKSEDRLIFSTKYARFISPNLGFAALVDFRSQFDKGYKYDVDVKDSEGNVIGKEDLYISNWLAPAFSVASLGFEYKNGDMFYVMASPLTSKITIVNDDVLSAAGAYGVEPGKKMRSEFGAYINSSFKYKLMDNVQYSTNLNLFMNYRTPKLIDIFWDNNISFTINKYLQSSFTTNLIYDDDVKILNSDGVTSSPKIQFKHVLSVGLILKLK
ncbi:MAG TPA: DUF3078 domain-containing protein [Catalimonadaceae bacterium]|nr:DUF3078 domain-containing protein [Catalimonadaceae bacterium]